MRKTLRYSIMCVLMLLSYLPAMAQDVTIDFTKETTEPPVDKVFSHTTQGFTFTATKEGGYSYPTHYGSTRDIRMYAKNKLVIESTTPFNKIVFNISNKGIEQWGDMIPLQGDMPVASRDTKTTTWTAPSPVTRIEFVVSDLSVYGTKRSTNGKPLSGQFCFNSVVITKASGNVDAVADPKFSHSTGNYFEPFDLTLSAPDGYTIRYTNDLSTPSEINGIEYREPIHISSLMTIKAVAFNPSNKKSFVISHTFTFPAVRNSISEMMVLDNNAVAKLSLQDAVVLASSNGRMFVADDTGAIMFFQTGLNYAAGTRLSGSLIAKFMRYEGLPEILKDGDNTNASQLTVTPGNPPTAQEVELADIKNGNMLCKLVKISNVRLDSAERKLYAVAGEERIEVYNNTLKAITNNTSIQNGSENNTITAIVSIFKDNYQLLPISIETVTTGINNVNAEVGNKTQEAIYNLAGQRVDANYKGVVVKNGKKYLQK